MLEDRRSEVLRALVEEYIRTGEPVSSRAVLDHSRIGVSPATVRHDLAQLEQEGMVVQPHTSAGRVPTAAAYRYYVDHLGPGRLRQPAMDRINSFFSDVHLELSKLLKATSDLLAEITDLPAVVVAPGVGRDRVRAIHTVQVSNDQVLVVVVTEGGRVVQQRGRVRVPVTPLEIEEGSRTVAAALVGSELASVTGLTTAALADLDEPTREAVLTITDCVHVAASTGSEVFVGGTQRLSSAWHDSNSMQQVLEVLEREAEVMKLLATASGTSIQLGPVVDEAEMDVAVVSTTYDASGDAGSVGVIGPMRMNYKRAISAVEQVSRELEEQIGAHAD